MANLAHSTPEFWRSYRLAVLKQAVGEGVELAREQHRRKKARRSCDYVDAYKQLHGCRRCGLKNPPFCLVLHHRDPSTKEVEISDVARSWAIGRIASEIVKCDVLCMNCHAMEHAYGRV